MATVRNDLAILPYSDPEMVFPKVAPVLRKYVPSGTEYYTPYNSDVTAQTGRTALGDITAHAVGSASTSFNCAEIIDRENMSYDAIKASYRDDLRAEMAMARVGKRAVSDKLDLQLKTALLGSPEDIHSESDICGAVEALAWTLADKAYGKIALVLSTKCFTALKGVSAIKDRMKNMGIFQADGDPRRITEAQMAAAFGVDEIVVGPNRVWGSGAGASCGALVVKPTPELYPNEEVQYARTFAYEFAEGGDGWLPFLCEVWTNDLIKGLTVDVTAKAAVVVLNSGLKQAIRFFQADASESGSDSASISG